MKYAECVLDCRAELGEGPLWDPEKEVLYWVNITGNEIHQFDSKTGKDLSFNAGQSVGAVGLRERGGLVAALGDGFYWIDCQEPGFPSCRTSFFAGPEENSGDSRFNDGKCGPGGRFWAGTMNTSEPKVTGAAGLYCLEPDGGVSKKIENITISNGITWSLDERIMYYIDTPAREIWAFDFDKETGHLSGKRTVVTVPPEEGMPDGMTRDREGMLWVAHWGGGKVVRWDPGNGKKAEEVLVPAPQTTSCMFGGADLDELYITTARSGLPEEELRRCPQSGGLFRVKPGIAGLPPYRFSG